MSDLSFMIGSPTVQRPHTSVIDVKPLYDTTVSGVGNVKVKAEGQGTVELISSCNGHNYILELKDVLYIPSNHNNLIALGKWDKAGGRYIGGEGALTLITKDGTSVS